MRRLVADNVGQWFTGGIHLTRLNDALELRCIARDGAELRLEIGGNVDHERRLHVVLAIRDGVQQLARADKE